MTKRGKTKLGKTSTGKKKYKLECSPQVKEFVSNLDPEEQDRFLDMLNQIKKNPNAGKKASKKDLKHLGKEAEGLDLSKVRYMDF